MHHIQSNGKARDVIRVMMYYERVISKTISTHFESNSKQILGLDSTFVTSVHFQNG